MGAKVPRTQAQVDQEKYASSFKTSTSFYIPSELQERMKRFCRERGIRQGFFAYVALMHELESEEFKKKSDYCEPM